MDRKFSNPETLFLLLLPRFIYKKNKSKKKMKKKNK